MLSCLCGESTSIASQHREAEWYSGTAQGWDPAALPGPCPEDHPTYVMHQGAGRATPSAESDMLGTLPPKMEQADACAAWEHRAK